ncbi:ABC transporter substrate-binding protein [Nesterenkonia alba]|uniref:ABC transporter substrate-binding protein n=1 Tax=Nesterenkonia alba TaxID=515814 RepID=UPI0003B5659B|nr:sugar ABC transporter substrate-binding protein [Nesterenkonia alba]
MPQNKIVPLALASLTVGALSLSACAGADAQDDSVSLRFALWGSETRVQNTENIIEAYQEENPEVSIEVEYNDWDGYWDRLNTQLAADDAPDIILMDVWNLGEYVERGSLLDLSDVDLSDVPDDVVASGSVDGGYYGLAQGINSPAIVANPRIFDEAGVAMPDDSTWTWEDFRDIAQEITENHESAYGAAGPDGARLFQAWLRQQGAYFMDAEGEIGFDADLLAEYFALLDDFRTSGAFPEAQTMTEDRGAGQDQSLLATGEAAMAFNLTNLLGAFTDASGEDLVLLRYPSPTGNASDAGLWYNTLVVSAASSTDHPEEVIDFLDFSINDERAARWNLSDRGVPANTEIRDALLDEMSEADLAAAEFITEIEDELGPPEPVPAAGFTEVADTLERYQDEVFFERMTPEEAAESLMAEIQ